MDYGSRNSHITWIGNQLYKEVQNCNSVTGTRFLTMHWGAACYCRYSVTGTRFLTMHWGAACYCRYSVTGIRFLTIHGGAACYLP